ncbi:MAG: DUF2116 family Zn-ribbon domain-containing protein [Promethearchaeota archaeon]
MSGSTNKTSSEVPPHRHCYQCGKVISLSNDYCSPECEIKDQERIKDVESIKFSMRIMVLLVAAALVINLILPLLLP